MAWQLLGCFPRFGRTKSALPGDAPGVSVLLQVARIPPSDLRGGPSICLFGCFQVD